MATPLAVRWSGLHDEEAVNAWDALSGPGPWNTAFGSSTLLEAITAISGHRVDQIAIADSIGVSAVARLVVRRRMGITSVSVPPFGPYSALVLRDDLKESEIHDRSSVLETLLETIEGHYHIVALHLPPDIQDLRVFSWRSWWVRPLYTYRIELDTGIDPSSEWSESARRIARQQASEFEIVAADAPTQARLVSESYERSGRQPPMDGSQITTLLNAIDNRGIVTTTSARNRSTGDIDASVTVLRDGADAYYWLAGSRPGASMTVLLAHLLPKLAADGVTQFDFVGANTAPIAEFKRRFGGQLRTYFRATWRRGIVGRLVGDRS